MADALERYLTLRIRECSYDEKYFRDICKELGHFVTVDAFVRLPQNVEDKLFKDFNVVLENLQRRGKILKSRLRALARALTNAILERKASRLNYRDVAIPSLDVDGMWLCISTIMRYMDTQTLLKFSETSKKWNAQARNDGLWRRLWEKDSEILS
ncbi:hypothetical protein L1887_16774 [Cichorium endivia]|nr:hypothetical protein L1887_16774 [Cichorium endivia]